MDIIHSSFFLHKGGYARNLFVRSIITFKGGFAAQLLVCFLSSLSLVWLDTHFMGLCLMRNKRTASVANGGRRLVGFIRIIKHREPHADKKKNQESQSILIC